MIAILFHPYLTRLDRWAPLLRRSSPAHRGSVFEYTPVLVYTFESTAARNASAEFVYVALEVDKNKRLSFS